PRRLATAVGGGAASIVPPLHRSGEAPGVGPSRKEGAMLPTVSLSQNDWSLHRKGPIDQARHNERVKEAIKDSLGEIVSQESIITSDGKKIVKVPIRSLELPRFRFDRGRKNHAGQGQGKSKLGDALRQDANGQGPG